MRVHPSTNLVAEINNSPLYRVPNHPGRPEGVRKFGMHESRVKLNVLFNFLVLYLLTKLFFIPNVLSPKVYFKIKQ